MAIPRSLHFGGLWEAAVKTTNHHFYRAVGPAVLPADDLRTFYSEPMAVTQSP